MSAGFSDYYCKPEEIGTHKLIWLLPIIIVSILIVLINEAAAVFVPAPLHSFVAPEHQNCCHCSAPSAAARKITEICLILITFPPAIIGVIYPKCG